MISVIISTTALIIFISLHALHATRSIYNKAVCPSVSLSVRLSNAWIVIKRQKPEPTFLHHMKDN